MCRVVVSRDYWERLKQIGSDCKEIRINCGYTQAQVAEEVKTNSSMISNFESGGNNSALILDWYVKHGYRG